MKRMKMKNSASKANFSRNAGTHLRKTRGNPMRGGIRL